ncbi:MAG TPA: hypothetical protein VKB87_21800, partial [Myxococcaceae bacterium]|nr:hypothetical protein [Myxococcaceae bacterium]
FDTELCSGPARTEAGLAVEAVSPQVRAEVGHAKIIGRGPSRIKSGSTRKPSEWLDTREVCWFWIGTHADYDKLLKRL